MHPLDALVQREIANAAKRVSVVTAISPRAIVDVLFVAGQAIRLVAAHAEKDLVRPPGTTRYQPMVAQLKSLLAYDHAQGAGADGAEFDRDCRSKGRSLWMVTLRDPSVDGVPDEESLLSLSPAWT